jgi:hypothetical protein
MTQGADLLLTARSETGLDDFGDDSFREGFERLVRALQVEARLSPAGREKMSKMIVRLLSQRLQIEDWYLRHPEIDDEMIEAPLVGIGLPRTGSTALSFLLAQDPGARSLRRWEAGEPCPPPSTVSGPDPRIDHARAETANLSVHRKALVPVDAEGPQECQALTAFDFKAHSLATFAGHVPSYSRWLHYEADMTGAYKYEQRVLKLLQWGTPARPWRLKAPTHLLYLDQFSRVFPDARFVMTHRDPTEVIVSVSDLRVEVGRPFSDHIDPHFVGALNLEQWSLGMKRAIAFRDRDADGRFYDIDFRSMQRDPLAEVRGLYAWMANPISPDFESGMKRWWQDNAERRAPNVYPDPVTFGIDLERVREEFSDYVKRMAAWTAR